MCLIVEHIFLELEYSLFREFRSKILAIEYMARKWCDRAVWARCSPGSEQNQPHDHEVIQHTEYDCVRSCERPE